MAKLPNPQNINRRAPTPGGPAGYLRETQISSPGADTSIGNALMGIGEDAHQLAMAEKARMDQVAIDDAQNQYLEQAMELETEYSQIKGKSAVDQDIDTDYTKKLDAVSEKISSGFKNDSQRSAWDSYYGKSKVRFRAGVLKHKLNESDKYAQETYIATNNVRIQNAHANWADTEIVNSSARDIVENIAREKKRSGWGEERTEAELKARLGPLWSGVAAQYINAKQYGVAKKLLDQHKDVIGVDKYTRYHESIKASELIDLSQEKAANILETIKGGSAQRAAAREIGGKLGDQTLTRIKTFQNEQRIQKQENQRVQAENDLKWVSGFGVEALGNSTLTVDQVKSAGLSDKNEALWMQKVFAQGAAKDKTATANKTKDTYADWLEKASLEPEKYTPEDVAKDINPNGGGLTGPQYTDVLSVLETSKTKNKKTSPKSAEVRGKAQLRAMYNRGDFGKISKKKPKQSEAWKTYSDILIDFQQKNFDEPDVDHTDWLNTRIEEEGMKKLYETLDKDWTWGPFRDDSDEIIKEWLIQHGKATSARNIEAVRNQYRKNK